MARQGGCFDNSHPRQKYNNQHGHQQGVENWIHDSGPSVSGVLILPGGKERRDSTDSDKENESLVQFPNDSNLQTSSHVCEDAIFFNKISSNDSVRNIRENHAEEDLDLLLTTLFSEDDRNSEDGPEKNLERSVKPVFELPRPEEIGLASFPETSDLVLSVCNNSNESFSTEPWQFSGNTEVDSPFQDHVEDQNDLDAALCSEMGEELDVGASDVFLGYETSSLDEDIQRALEFPVSNNVDFFREDISVDIGVLQEDFHQVSMLPGDHIEDSLTDYEELKAEFFQTEDGTEDFLPGVRTRRGRKRKPGTVVDLLLSSYHTRKRNTRCKDCGPCRAPDCGLCVCCLDKPKFGGRNKKKAACLERKCLHMGLANTKLVVSNSQSGPATMNEEDGEVIKHDHCYSLLGETDKAVKEEINLWCFESLDEFMAETLEVQLEKTPDSRNISVEVCEKQEELEVSGSLEVYYEGSRKDQRNNDSQKAFQGELWKMKLNPKVKRRKGNFK